MSRLNREERRAELKQRMQQQCRDKDKGGGKKQIFNFSNYEDVYFFKAKEGKNEIDILPFEVTTSKEPLGFTIGSDQYKLEYWRHTQIGPNDDMVLCLNKTYGKPCPICEAMKEMLDNGTDWKDKEIEALKPKQRCMYNIIDVNDTEKGVQVFEQSHFKFELPLFSAAEYKNPDFITFADVEDGYTITFKGTEETFKKGKFIAPSVFDFVKRDPYDEDIYDDVFPLDSLLEIPTYEEVQALFMGVEIENKDIPEPKKETKTKERKKKTEPKTEEKPARRGRKAKEEPEPPVNDGPSCPVEGTAGLIIGTDWDISDVCKDCPDETYNVCQGLYDELEKEKAEAKKKEEEKKEDKPARRPRRR